MSSQDTYCECDDLYDLYRWRDDPDWWSCVACDGRVRPLTEPELEEANEPLDRERA